MLVAFDNPPSIDVEDSDSVAILATEPGGGVRGVRVLDVSSRALSNGQTFDPYQARAKAAASYSYGPTRGVHLRTRILVHSAVGIALLFAAATVPAQAEYLQTGDTLLVQCKSGADGALACLGYISGVADALAAGNAINNARACFPKVVTVGLLQDVVVKFLELRRKERHFAAVGLVAAALNEAFPCPKPDTK